MPRCRTTSPRTGAGTARQVRKISVAVAMACSTEVLAIDDEMAPIDCPLIGERAVNADDSEDSIVASQPIAFRAR